MNDNDIRKIIKENLDLEKYTINFVYDTDGLYYVDIVSSALKEAKLTYYQLTNIKSEIEQSQYYVVENIMISSSQGSMLYISLQLSIRS